MANLKFGSDVCRFLNTLLLSTGRCVLSLAFRCARNIVNDIQCIQITCYWKSARKYSIGQMLFILNRYLPFGLSLNAAYGESQFNICVLRISWDLTALLLQNSSSVSLILNFRSFARHPNCFRKACQAHLNLATCKCVRSVGIFIPVNSSNLRCLILLLYDRYLWVNILWIAQ